MNNIINYFSENIRQALIGIDLGNLEEVRLRVNKPIILKYHMNELILKYILNSSDILETLEHICENSIYSYKNQMCNGYITIQGGHRVGISGNVILEEDKVINIKYLSGLNFRIARQVIGCSNKIIKHIIDYKNKTIFNTLIVSSPGCGKTTILRDTIRQISTGIEGAFDGINVGLVDERGEIAAMYKGVSQNDIGMRTDILDNVPKHIGMKMLIRSMSPKVISTDEIGSYDDVIAINYAICSGVKGIFTAHGNSLKDLTLNPALNEILNKNLFEKVICLGRNITPGEIESIYFLDKNDCVYKEYREEKRFVINI